MQIRMILLEHFHKFMNLFPENELKGAILPQLLLGIKDTNDHLVSMTLRCLADLIPILGASIVIGRNRNRIFADGRPQRVAADNNPLTRHWPEARSITPVMEGSADHGLDLCQQSFADVSTENLMPIRLEPDGGEEEVGEVVMDGDAGEVEVMATGEEDQWSDWENDEEDEQNVERLEGLSSLLIETPAAVRPKTDAEIAAMKALTLADNLNELDIQVKPTKDEDEMDFFKDMEPVIVKREVNLIDKGEKMEESGPKIDEEEEKFERTSRLTIQAVATEGDAAEGEAGWGDSDWE